MYLTPYRRSIRRRLESNDSRAASFGHIHSDVHVPMDIMDEKESYLISAVLPGLSSEDIDIEIVKNTIDIRGEFKEIDSEEAQILRRERPTGSFRRSFRFSTNLDAAKAEARLENGILTLRLPKVAEALPKSIKVKTK
jgi:HSP20 family protein